MVWLWPVGATKRVGASESRRRFRSQGNSVSRAKSRSWGEISSSRVFPVRNGASQSHTVAASASSERSGQVSGSTDRRNCTRSRSCLCALVHGRRSMPICAMPRANSSGATSGGTGRGSLERTIAPSRRTRRARSAADSRSNVISSASVIRSPAI